MIIFFSISAPLMQALSGKSDEKYAQGKDENNDHQGGDDDLLKQG